MLLPILSCYKHFITTISRKHSLRFISNVPFNETFTVTKYQDNLLVRKFYDFNDWYIKFTGLDEVKRLQDKVIITQERLERIQAERREIGKIIVDVRKDATILQDQLHQINKWENVQKFVDLTQKEAESMKKEKELTAQFEILDKQERELFSTLCNTIRDSHEKEKAQSEYTKYWGIILSIIASIFGAVISTIISSIRNKQIVVGINNNMEAKFKEIASMYKMGNVNNGGKDETSILFVENRDLSKRIFMNLSENLKEIQELRNDTNNFNDVLKVLFDNITDIKNKIDRPPFDEMKQIKLNDKILIGRLSGNSQQIEKVELGAPSVLAGLVGVIISALCCCCR